nr:uncharacterized protein LOC122273516 [Parasteatoda tepidariorum]
MNDNCRFLKNKYITSVKGGFTNYLVLIMSKKYKQYLWKNESLPIRTFSRYRSNMLFGVNDIQDKNFNVPSTSNVETSQESEICEIETEAISSESSLNNSTLSDKSDTEEETSSEDIFPPKDDFENLIKNCYKPIYESADVTNLEAFVSILAYSIKFNLSKSCVDGLLKLLKTLLPPCNLPETKYIFYKGTSAISNACELHLYCPHCDSYISKLSQHNSTECLTCSESFNSDELIKNGNFFLYMPLSHQLQLKLENEDLLNNK